MNQSCWLSPLTAFLLLASYLSSSLADAGRDAVLEKSLDSYLNEAFPAHIDRVRLKKDQIIVSGQIDREKVPASESLFVAEIPVHILYGAEDPYADSVPLLADADGKFTIALPRFRIIDDQPYDRMTSRWRILQTSTRDGEGHIPTALSADHWVDEIDEPSEFPTPQSIPHKKGIGGWRGGTLPNELRDLGIGAITINVVLNRYLSLHADRDAEPISWQGHQFFVRRNVIQTLDSTLQTAAEDGVVVSAILLVSNPARDRSEVNSVLGHSDATESGMFAMPNVTDERGVALYGAILKYLTERYERSDGRYGRIHHWIVHNEVDAAPMWNNAGEKSTLTYLDLYQRSLRLVDLFARQIDPASRSFISLTHQWTSPKVKGWHGSRRLLELLVRYGEVEGDFPWALAFHPYPQDLFEPRTWKDNLATDSFDTVKLTPRNLQILDAWMKQDRLLYRGQLRPVHLSENGFNSRDYGPVELEAQAAGMVYAWQKIQPLSSVQVWHYHNWIDNRGEGGLRIGLRKFPDDPDDPLGKKPIWEVYRAAGTTDEEAVFRPYLDFITHSP